MSEVPGAAGAPAGTPAGGAPAGGTPTPDNFLGTPPAGTPPAGGAAGGTPPANPYPKEDWRHSLPDDIRGDESIKLLNDVPTLAKSFLHARKQIGANKVALPSQHATEDDVQQFYDSLGRPKLEEYKPNAPKNAKYVTAEDVAALVPIAHKAGIMPAQLEAILGHYETKQTEATEAYNKNLTTTLQGGMDSLQKEWGKAYDQRASWAKRFVEEKGGPEAAAFFKDNKTASWNPALIKMFAAAGELIYREDTINNGEGGGNLLDPKQALEKYNNIIMDMKHPYNLAEHPNHAAAVKEAAGLFDQAYPKTEAS